MFHIILRDPARCIAAVAARGRIVVPYREVANDLNMMFMRHSDSESAGNKPDADRGLSKTRTPLVGSTLNTWIHNTMVLGLPLAYE